MMYSDDGQSSSWIECNQTVRHRYMYIPFAFYGVLGCWLPAVRA